MSIYEDVANRNKAKLEGKDNVKGFETYQPNWIDMRSIQSRTQPWLWPDVLPLGNVALIAGIGGVGKSSFLLGLSAAITNGVTVSICGKEVSFSQGGVIYLGAEDEPDTSIKPKLEAFNANFDNFHYIQDQIGNRSQKRKGLSLDMDLGLIESRIIEVNSNPNLANIQLIIIDPITYYLGNVKDYVSTEVANFIMGLKEVATKYNLAIVICKHLRKQASGNNLTNLINEVGGSSAWINSPRMAWAIYEHPDDPAIKLMSNIKANIIARHAKSLNFTIKPFDLPNGIKTTVIKWGGQSTEIDPNLAGNAELYQNSKLQKAINFIFDYLEDGHQRFAKDIQKAGMDEGHSKKTMRNALDTVRLKYKHRVQEDKLGKDIVLKMNSYDA